MLQRAQTAFEQQSVALTETRNELGRVRAEATASSQAATSIGDSRLVDPRNIPKPPLFDDKRESWERWKYIFLAWASTVNTAYSAPLEKAEQSATPIEHDELSDSEVRLSRALLTILMGYAPDCVMGMAQHAPEGNGWKCGVGW